MIISTLKEIKDNENRVGLIPDGVKKLTELGHQVSIQNGAGEGAGFSDEEYKAAGAEILEDSFEIAKKTDILVKVKEPLPNEYHLLEHLKGKTLFTYLHLSGVDPHLTNKLLECSITSIAYETVEDEQGHLPLLAPMSEIAGVLAIQYAGEFLQKKHHGLGITLGNISHTEQPLVVIIGAGIVGTMAAKCGAGIGSKVRLFDINQETLNRAEIEIKAHLGSNLFQNVKLMKAEKNILDETLRDADVLIGAVLLKGTKAPRVVSEEQVHLMKKGAVIIDVAIDQGGCVWGSRPTTHSNPIFGIDGKIFCCVANMPGQVARQSTQALCNATIPYIIKMANQGVIKSLAHSERFARGLNTFNGKITYKSVAKDLNMENSFEEISSTKLLSRSH